VLVIDPRAAIPLCCATARTEGSRMKDGDLLSFSQVAGVYRGGGPPRPRPLPRAAAESARAGIGGGVQKPAVAFAWSATSRAKYAALKIALNVPVG